MFLGWVVWFWFFFCLSSFFGTVCPFPGFCHFTNSPWACKASSKPWNKTCQTGAWDCSENAPEQFVLGRTVAVAQTEPRSCRNFSQSSNAGANCLDLLYLEVHVLEMHELLSKTASDSWLHSRLYIGHLFSSHRTTARVCQKCGTQAHCAPWGHSCPANMPRRRGEDQARAECFTQTVPSVLLWFSGILKS